MKKLVAILGLTTSLLCVAFAPSVARAESGNAGTFTVNPLDLVNGYVNFEVDFKLAPPLSFHGGLNFLVADEVWHDNRKGSTFAFGPEIGLRLYPFLSAPAGLFIGPYAGVAYVRVDNNGADASRAGVYCGGEVGATFIFGNLVVVALGAGLGYEDLSAVVEGDRIGRRGLSPRFRLGLGLAF